MSVSCGCFCACHEHEADASWPGPCAGCCEAGDACECGRVLALHDARVVRIAAKLHASMHDYICGSDPDSCIKAEWWQGHVYRALLP